MFEEHAVTISEVPTRSPVERVNWAGLFAAIDRRDAEGFVEFLTAGAEFRFGNSPVIAGRANIAAAVRVFFGMIAGCRHEVTATWSGPASAVCEGQVTYTVPAGSTVRVPFVNVFETAGGLISHYRIYIDNAPLFAALG
jgi:ketosteroid isomerase-like protein